ncbi:unnamed protein product [Acholeplasma phage MV-L51]|uniref:Uncharacterized protein n=1 Tax=Acholeplasma phage MV-L51 TaxID=1977403 RepID=Q04394_9VIRU|nr:hypothetical protein L1_4 [Acholeplasma phage MV-L51]CAA41651.1 unnamed protein product [Acholeplasma phage MV-L51]
MKFQKIHKYEGLDLFLSDVQTALPKQTSFTHWLPVFFGLAGQLYNMLIIINSQEFERPWVKLRGQQDKYYRAIKTTPFNKSFIQKYVWNEIPILKNYIFIKIRSYSELQSAQQNVLPFNAIGLINEGSKHLVLTAGQATKEQFEATYGEIKERTIVINKKHIMYDSRIFHKYFYGITAQGAIELYNKIESLTPPNFIKQNARGRKRYLLLRNKCPVGIIKSLVAVCQGLDVIKDGMALKLLENSFCSKKHKAYDTLKALRITKNLN